MAILLYLYNFKISEYFPYKKTREINFFEILGEKIPDYRIPDWNHRLMKQFYTEKICFQWIMSGFRIFRIIEVRIIIIIIVLLICSDLGELGNETAINFRSS